MSRKMGMASKNRTATGVTFIILLLLAVISLLPFFIVFITAFKSDTEVSLAGFKWMPEHFNLDNFRAALNMGDWGLFFKNSLIITGVTVAGSVVINSMSGYAFARLNFPGKDVLFVTMLIGMMVPPQSIIIPQFIILRSFPGIGGNNWLGQGGMGLLDTHIGLILPFLAGAFGVFLCKQFYISFPVALDDAAKIDGCSAFGIYIRIYLPLSKQILATLCILKSVSTWNDFFFPLIISQSTRTFTVQLGLQLFIGTISTHWNWLMAGTLITIIPIIVVYLLAQEQFVQGIATSGMKN